MFLTPRPTQTTASSWEFVTAMGGEDFPTKGVVETAAPNASSNANLKSPDDPEIDHASSNTPPLLPSITTPPSPRRFHLGQKRAVSTPASLPMFPVLHQSFRAESIERDAPSPALRRTASLPLFPSPDSFEDGHLLPFRGSRRLAPSDFNTAISLRPRRKRERDCSEDALHTLNVVLSDEIRAEHSDENEGHGQNDAAKRTRTNHLAPALSPRKASFGQHEYRALLERVLGSPSTSTTVLLRGGKRSFPRV